MDTLRAVAARREQTRTLRLAAEAVLLWSLPLAIPLIMLWFVVNGEPTSARITAKQVYPIALLCWLLLFGGAILVALVSSMFSRRITRRMEQECEALPDATAERLIAGECLDAYVVRTPDERTLRLEVPMVRRVALDALKAIGVLGYACGVLLLLTGVPSAVWLFFMGDQGTKKGIPAFCALASLGICAMLIGRHTRGRLANEARRSIGWSAADAPTGNGLLVKGSTVRRKMGDEIETLITFDKNRCGRDFGALCAARLATELERRYGVGSASNSRP